jgi:hypothetical protein
MKVDIEDKVVCVDCGDVVEEFDVGEVGIAEGGGRGRGISKISTTSEYPMKVNPPPKNILFVDDVAASQKRS